jgi:signal transduction histidine kinase
VFFRIANTGPEIPEEHENRIFERFYRADLSRSSEVRGSGLGLSICREIVLAHEGQIWLERPRPGWTAFVFTLPAAQDERDRTENRKLVPGSEGGRSDRALKAPGFLL